jgi:hypothetical protein
VATTFTFDKLRQNLAQVKKDLPRLLANDAQNYFLGAFKNEGWDGSKWKEVQRRIEGTPEYKYPLKKGLSRHDKKILIGTGRLRREVSNIAANARVSESAFNFTVTLSINSNIVPYEGYNNFGTEHIPARQFMGDSPGLRAILRKRIVNYIDKIW